MMVPSGNVTRRLLETLLEDQNRRAKYERTIPFVEKLKVVDQLMAEGEPKVEDLSQE